MRWSRWQPPQLAVTPPAAQAFGPGGETETGIESVPRNGNREISTSELPSAATQAGVDVQPTAAIDAFDGLTLTLSYQHDLHSAIVVCINMYVSATSIPIAHGVAGATADLESFPYSTIGFSLEDPLLQDLLPRGLPA